jgi:hypothetical protein
MDGAAQPPTPDTSSIATVQDRLVLQREPSRGDLQVDVRRARDHFIVSLSGRLAETFKGEELGRRLVGHVVFDTSGVDRVTSFGVRAWLAMLDAMDADSVTFARCSEAVLAQMGMIRSFVGEGQIASFFAPYVCESCGNAFRVHYDALRDAERIRDARPIDVDCPRCKALCTLDDDPQAFFRMAPLLTDPSEELRTALGRLSPLGSDADAIEKVIRGETTVVRFNTRLDASLRLGRIFDGLEGRVELDLGRVPEATEPGIQAFLRAVENLDAEVRKVRLIGCPQALAEAVLADDPPRRLHVYSVLVPARCGVPPTTRTVFVDIAANASELAAGLPPDLRCDWCDDGLSVAEAMPLLQQLAVRLQPAPVPSDPEPSSRLPLALVAGSTFLTASAVLLGMVGMVVLAALWLTVSTPDESGWIAGRTPPPPWTESVWTRDDAGVLVVAGADGPDLDTALLGARERAVQEVVRRVRDELADDPIYTRTDATVTPQAVERYLVDVSAFGHPARDEVVVRQGGRDTRLFARYRLSSSDWSAVLDHYRARVPFRGLQLGRLFPTEPADPPGVPVVETASWLSTPSAGDRLVAVDGQPVATLADAQVQLESHWASVPPGGVLPLTFVAPDGHRFLVNFQKKATE